MLLISKNYFEWDTELRYFNLQPETKIKKNTLTGPVNCKKANRHHAHLSLCANSRKTNDAKSRKWPKT